MDVEETAELLSLAALTDRRDVDEAVLEWWHELLAETDYRDGRAALIRHYRTSREYLMPVHITQGVLDLERARLDAFGPIYPDPAIMEMHHLTDEEELRMEMQSRRDRLALVKRGLLVRGPGGREVRLDGAGAIEA